MSRYRDLPCVDDPELFFPVGECGPALEQQEAAKATCLGCPVRLECLELALQTEELEGVRGGTCSMERAAMLRTRREAEQADEEHAEPAAEEVAA